MPYAYLADSQRAIRQTVFAAIGAATSFIHKDDVGQVWLGALPQTEGALRSTDEINVVIHHLSHDSESMTDGRVRNNHYYELEILCRDARKAMLAADEIYQVAHNRTDNYDSFNTHLFFPESVGIRYNDQDYYMATVNIRASVTQN